MADDFEKQSSEVFDKLQSLLTPEEALPAVEKGAKLIQARAKSLAPVDMGALRNGIITDAYVENSDVVSEVSATAPYSGYVEFGTGPKGAASQGSLPAGIDPLPASAFAQKGWALPPDVAEKLGYKFTNGQAAQPYMMPAFLAEKDKVVQIVQKGLLDAVSRAFGGGV